MNKRKSRSELEHELFMAKTEISSLKSMIKIYDAKFEKMAELKDSTPSDCTQGVWCRTCQFVRVFFSPNRHIGYNAYVCAKGETCSNYIQMEGEKI